MDIIVELIRTRKGNVLVLVITDCFTRMVKKIPMKSISAAEVARHLVKDWVSNCDPPVDILADDGGAFTSKVFQNGCKLMNILNSSTKTYHPQANCQVERYNRTIIDALKTCVANTYVIKINIRAH